MTSLELPLLLNFVYCGNTMFCVSTKRKSTYNVWLQNCSIFRNQFQFIKSIAIPKLYNRRKVGSWGFILGMLIGLHIYIYIFWGAYIWSGWLIHGERINNILLYVLNIYIYIYICTYIYIYISIYMSIYTYIYL